MGGFYFEVFVDEWDLDKTVTVDFHTDDIAFPKHACNNVKVRRFASRFDSRFALRYVSPQECDPPPPSVPVAILHFFMLSLQKWRLPNPLAPPLCDVCHTAMVRWRSHGNMTDPSLPPS